MSDYSFGDSQNPKAKRLHDKALILAALALALQLKSTMAKLGHSFFTFVIKWDTIPWNLRVGA